MTKNVRLSVGALALVVVLLGAYWFFDSRSKIETGAEPTDSLEEELSGLAVGESVNDGGYTIERLPDAPAVSAPSLEPIPPKPASVSDAAYQQISKNFAATAAVLAEGDNFNAWMNIAAYHGMLENYRGAEEVLQYLLVVYSPEWQVHANLGNLYAGPLLNLPEAAEQYRLAIGKFATNAALYRALFEVESRQGNTVEATKALRDGIAQAPESLDLYVLLARNLRDTGSVSDARDAYDQAIERAAAAGNTELSSSLTAERDQLQ